VKMLAKAMHGAMCVKPITKKRDLACVHSKFGIVHSPRISENEATILPSAKKPGNMLIRY